MMNPQVDAFFEKAKKWKSEMEELRMIALDCKLTEEYKWSKPCYTFDSSNVMVIQGFKDYCALLFFKGVLMQDPDNMLVKTGENTRVGRQIRFTDVNEIIAKEPIIKDYIKQAIEIEKAGLKVDPPKPKKMKIPSEFQIALDQDAALKEAFESLTPGRQKSYLYHFSSAKQSETRSKRVEKYIPKIKAGKGFQD